MSGTNEAADDPVAKTRYGEIRGEQRSGVNAFLGIPFAMGPVVQLRFSSPRPPVAETVLRDRRRFGLSPAQPRTKWLDPMAELSEDSLVLNVWAPAGANDGRPVIVWVYGGGFLGGTSSTAATDATALARENDVVVVTVNYRVGMLGFASLAHVAPDLSEATNLGVQDVVAALRWVHGNIESFGGNPGDITLAGHSAGAFICSALLAAPSARGLFQKLALFSGGPWRLIPLPQAQAISDLLLSAVGTRNAEKLREIPWREFIRAQQTALRADAAVRFGPTPTALGVVLDAPLPHGVVREHPMDTIRSGAHNEMPLMICVAKAETVAFRDELDPLRANDPMSIEEDIASWGVPKSRATAIAAEYARRASKLEPQTLNEAVLTDWMYHLPAVRAAAAHSLAGGRAWLAAVETIDGSAAIHGQEIPLIFGPNPSTNSVAIDLRRRLGTFARTGNPGWRPFEPEDRISYGFGSAAGERSGRFDKVSETWNGIERP
jgi:para-nitrobenzyl esterase